jgi:PAS domain S-box-containing protein
MTDSRPMEIPSEIEQRQSERRSQSLRRTMLVIAGLMMVMALVDHWLAPPGDSRAYISVTLGTVTVALFLIFQGHSRWWGVPLLVCGVLLSGAWAVYSYGSVRAAAGLALWGAVVLAGTYLSVRAMLLTAVTGLLVLAAFTWAEQAGYLRTADMAADFRFWSMATVIILVVGVLLLHLRRMTDEAHLSLLYQMEDRVRLEYERDRSLRRFRRVFELNPNALLIQAAPTLKVLEVNPAFERALGYRAEELAGASASSLWADSQQWREHQQRLAQHGCTKWQKARWLRSDGQAAEVFVFSELSEDHGGQIILTTVTDVR